MLAGALFAAAPALGQTAGDGQLCRVRFVKTTTGTDTMTMSGVVNVASADGGDFKGRGEAQVSYAHQGTCNVLSGSPFTARIRATVKSSDGRTADVSLIADDTSFPVVLKCGKQISESEALFYMPPAVHLPLKAGASVPFTAENRVGFGKQGETGTVSLEFCGD
jgi:hypothetical protein